MGSIYGWGTKIPQTAWHSKNKKLRFRDLLGWRLHPYARRVVYCKILGVRRSSCILDTSRPCLLYFFIWMFICILYAMLSHFSRFQLCATHRRQPTRLPRSWDSPGKNTGVGCHFLLQCMKVKSESEVAQSCLTLSDPMDCSLTGSSVHGIFQARVLEWGAIAFSVVSFIINR